MSMAMGGKQEEGNERRMRRESYFLAWRHQQHQFSNLQTRYNYNLPTHAGSVFCYYNTVPETGQLSPTGTRSAIAHGCGS